MPATGPEFPFGVGSTVPGAFLNNLEDLLYSYADSILPTSTGTQVLIQATAGDEAQVVIDREMWVMATSLKTPVLGPAGTYDVYVGASTVPTSHATAVMGFDLVVATTPPPYDFLRHIATVDWNGSLITSVLQDARKLNAAQLDGFEVNTTGAAVLPVASSNGKLDASLKPFFPGVDAALGEVIDYWSPPGSPFGVPSAWALCVGQTLPSGGHDFGPFAVTLPDARDKLILGASPSAILGTAGSPSNLASAAPGIGGVKAAHLQDSDLNHSHVAPSHSHTAQHHHGLNSHTHTTDPAGHKHAIGQANWTHYLGAHTLNIVTDPNGATILTDAHTLSTDANGTTNGPNVSTTFDTVPTTDIVTPSVTFTAPSVESRPLFHGFARIIKVHT